jgi:alpha-N-arabinofuranosidase
VALDEWNYWYGPHVFGELGTRYFLRGALGMMYRRHFGTIPVEMTGAPEPLDVAAAWTADRTALTISVVNPTFETQRLTFRVEGVACVRRAA